MVYNLDRLFFTCSFVVDVSCMCTFDLFDESLSILSLRLCPAEKE